MYLKDIVEAAFDGVISIPRDLAYGARRVYEDFGGEGQSVAQNNTEERERIIQLIKESIRFINSDNSPISRIIKIILTRFYNELPTEALTEAAKKSGIGISYLGSRYTTQVILVSRISQKITFQITEKVIVKKMASFGLSFIVSGILLEGMVERASNASKRLKKKNINLYNELKSKNLDMAYFLVEDPLSPIIDFISKKTNKKEDKKRIMEEINNEKAFR